jgi:hypothetical protein
MNAPIIVLAFALFAAILVLDVVMTSARLLLFPS